MYSIKANNEHVYLIVFQDFQTSKLLWLLFTQKDRYVQ